MAVRLVEAMADYGAHTNSHFHPEEPEQHSKLSKLLVEPVHMMAKDISTLLVLSPTLFRGSECGHKALELGCRS